MDLELQLFYIHGWNDECFLHCLRLNLTHFQFRFLVFHRPLLLSDLYRANAVLIFFVCLFVSSRYCNINTAFFQLLLLQFFSFTLHFPLHRFTCSLNAFAQRDVKRATQCTIYWFIIFNFFLSLHSFWLILFHIVSFRFVCVSMPFFFFYYIRLTNQIRDIKNQPMWKEHRFLKGNENATIFNGYNQMDFIPALSSSSSSFNRMKQVQKVKFKKIAENSTPLLRFTSHKQTSYRLHDEHLFRNHIKVHVTAGREQAGCWREREGNSSFEIEM